MAKMPAAALKDCLRTQQIELTDDPTLSAMQSYLSTQFGDALDAVILYGSYLRGERDTLLDLYVLLNQSHSAGESGLERIGRKTLPPNVYYLPASAANSLGHAKFAVIGTEQLAQRVNEDFHSYFWSRLAQPCCVVFSRDRATADRVLSIRTAAVQRCLYEAAMLPRPVAGAHTPAGDSLTLLWQPLFEHTYRCELRSESPDRARALLAFNESYYQSLAECWIAEQDSLPQPSSAFRLSARRWLGKGLSLARLCKAALTFSDGIEYLLWKVERHSGLHFEASPRQRRYPLLFAWPLVWRVWRAGGFR